MLRSKEPRVIHVRIFGRRCGAVPWAPRGSERAVLMCCWGSARGPGRRQRRAAQALGPGHDHVPALARGVRREPRLHI